jgi:hypothetical protein
MHRQLAKREINTEVERVAVCHGQGNTVITTSTPWGLGERGACGPFLGWSLLCCERFLKWCTVAAAVQRREPKSGLMACNSVTQTCVKGCCGRMGRRNHSCGRYPAVNAMPTSAIRIWRHNHPSSCNSFRVQIGNYGQLSWIQKGVSLLLECRIVRGQKTPTRATASECASLWPPQDRGFKTHAVMKSCIKP